MPIGKIVGIEHRNYTDKQTGEYKSNRVIHYTHKLNAKGDEGIGAGSVYVDVEKYDIPLEMGSFVLVEKNNSGFLSNLELIQALEKKPENK